MILKWLKDACSADRPVGSNRATTLHTDKHININRLVVSHKNTP